MTKTNPLSNGYRFWEGNRVTATLEPSGALNLRDEDGGLEAYKDWKHYVKDVIKDTPTDGNETDIVEQLSLFLGLPQTIGETAPTKQVAHKPAVITEEVIPMGTTTQAIPQTQIQTAGSTSGTATATIAPITEQLHKVLSKFVLTVVEPHIERQVQKIIKSNGGNIRVGSATGKTQWQGNGANSQANAGTTVATPVNGAALKPCTCGCGELTPNQFVKGHVARLRKVVIAVQSGQMDIKKVPQPARGYIKTKLGL